MISKDRLNMIKIVKVELNMLQIAFEKFGFWCFTSLSKIGVNRSVRGRDSRRRIDVFASISNCPVHQRNINYWKIVQSNVFNYFGILTFKSALNVDQPFCPTKATKRIFHIKIIGASIEFVLVFKIVFFAIQLNEMQIDWIPCERQHKVYSFTYNQHSIENHWTSCFGYLNSLIFSSMSLNFNSIGNYILYKMEINVKMAFWSSRGLNFLFCGLFLIYFTLWILRTKFVRI